MLRPQILQHIIVGSWVLITINMLLFGFVIFLPQFFLRQRLTITASLAYTPVLSVASQLGAGYIYARFNAASDPAIVLSVGFVLIVAIYVQTAILFGVYFIVGALLASYKLPGVVWLMIGLVVIQIVVVWAWGVEPRNRGLEDLATAKA